MTPLEKMVLRVGIAWLAVFLFVVAAIVGHNLARAAAQADCQSVPWGFLGSQTRTLCDTPLAPDGSWTRRRTIWVPAHQVPIVTHCYGGPYSSSCTTTGGGYVGDVIISQEEYPVNPAIVLQDEPGHLG